MKLLSSLLLLFLILATSHAQTQLSVEEHHKRGLVLADKGDLDGAINEFNIAIEKNPDFADSYHRRGGVKLRKGDMDAALADFNKAIQTNPDLAAAYQDRAMLRELKGELDNALSDYNHAIALGGSIEDSYIGRGSIRRRKADLDGAISDYSAALAINPRSVSALINRGITLRVKGDLDAALYDLNTAIELNPKLPHIYIARGDVRQKKGDLEGAKSDYRKATKATSSFGSIVEQRDSQKRGDKENKASNAQILNADISVAYAYIQLGRLAMKERAFDDAIANFSRAIENLPPNSFPPYSERAEALQEKSDLKGAVTDLTKAIELNPKVAAYYQSRGIVLLLQGKDEDAQRDFESYLKLEPGKKALLEKRIEDAKQRHARSQ